MINLILGTILVVSIPLILILIFRYLDNELADVLKLKKKALLIILVTSFVISVSYYILYGNTNNMYYIHCMILSGYLIFMSYTDQLTTMLYSSVSVVMIIYELTTLLLTVNVRELEEYNLLIFIFPIVFGIMSLFRWIGFGDVLIYCVLVLFLTQHRVLPTFSMIINVFITNALFLLTSLILRKKDKHRPLTIFIAISTFLCNLVLI